MTRGIISSSEILEDENNSLEEATFEDIEPIEEIITGAHFGLIVCCFS